MMSLTIPAYILEPSQHSLISITSSFQSISKLMRTVTCFPNLEVLRIQDERNDHFLSRGADAHRHYYPFSPENIFGTCATDKFKKLKHLTLRKQCITTSFSNIIFIVASLSALNSLTIQYCKFSLKPLTTMEISKYYCNKSNTLKHLNIIGMKIGNKRLSLIGNYFSNSLQNLVFNHCILPVKLQIWKKFAETCQYLQHLSVSILPFTLDPPLTQDPTLATYASRWGKMNEIIDNSILSVLLRDAFKNRSNVNMNVIIGNKSNSKPKANEQIYGLYAWNEPVIPIPLSEMWISPKQYEQCNLCQSKVGVGFMKDHLESVCINEIIQCILCLMNIRRCNMVSHWDNDCKGYEYECYECFLNFNNRNNYLEHCGKHAVWNDYSKPIFFINNVHSEKQREQYFDSNSVQMAWKCLKCERRCFGLESDHNCLHEWKLFSLNENTVPSLFGQDVVAYWIRNEIEYKYKLYAGITKDIHLLILAFIVQPHIIDSLPKLA